MQGRNLAAVVPCPGELLCRALSVCGQGEGKLLQGITGIRVLRELGPWMAALLGTNLRNT